MYIYIIHIRYVSKTSRYMYVMYVRKNKLHCGVNKNLNTSSYSGIRVPVPEQVHMMYSNVCIACITCTGTCAHVPYMQVYIHGHVLDLHVLSRHVLYLCFTFLCLIASFVCLNASNICLLEQLSF